MALAAPDRPGKDQGWFRFWGTRAVIQIITLQTSAAAAAAAAATTLADSISGACFSLPADEDLPLSQLQFSYLQFPAFNFLPALSSSLH